MRTGLFLSRDHGAISATVDVDALAREFSQLAAVRVYDTFFSAEAQRDLVDTVRREALQGVVLAGDSPRHFRRVPSGTGVVERIVAQGVNRNRVVFANLEQQVALPHAGNRPAATRKARALIETELARVESVHDVDTIAVVPRRSVLVVGTSEGGLLAARALLEKRYRVILVEAGTRPRIAPDFEGSIQATLATLQLDEHVQFHFGTRVRDVAGWVGDYSVLLRGPDAEHRITVGGIILALAGDTELIAELRPLLQLDTDEHGQLLEDGQFGMVGQTGARGVFFIPRRSKRSLLSEATARAAAVVLSLTTLLDRDELYRPVLISEIDESVCGGCGTCVKTCAFAASGIDFNRKLSTLDPRRCKGCGNCVVACPTGARDLLAFPRDHFVRAVEILAHGAPEPDQPKVLALLCAGCGYPAADVAGELAAQIEQLKYPANVMPLQVECGGNVDTQYVLQAFRHGFDGVAVTVCRDGHCHHVVGNTDMDRRLGLFREVLRSRRIDPERVRVIHVSPEEGKLFSQEIQAFFGELATGAGAAVA